MKFQKLIILIIFCLCLSISAIAQIDLGLDKVKQIKLLESNRDDVRRIFAGYKFELGNDSDYSDTFYTEDAEISIKYSIGKCSNDDGELAEFYDNWEFNIDEWKVTAIMIIPKNSVKLEDLSFNTIKFQKERIYIDSQSFYLFHNKILGIGFTKNEEENKIEDILIKPNKKLYPKLCNKNLSQKMTKNKSAFLRPLKERRYVICGLINIPPDVHNIILSYSEVTKTCHTNTDCSNNIDIVAVFAAAKDFDGDVLTYNYQVTGGRIVGNGDKVLWDLSDVKPGTYSITASVDDGCGFCGKSFTKTITVKE